MQNSNFPPNLNPHVFSLIAVAVGYACVGDYDTNEQNSIGNWLILVGQYILTHASQQQLIEGRIESMNININSKKSKSGNGPFTSDHNKSNQNQRPEVEFLLDAVEKIQNELNNLKK